MIVNVSNSTKLELGVEYLLVKQTHSINRNASYALYKDTSYYGKIHGSIVSNNPLFYYELLGVRRVLSFELNKNGISQRVALSKDLYPNQQ